MAMISRVLNAQNCCSIFEECSRMLLIMSVISFGVLVASYEEIDSNWIGLVYQMGGVVREALRLIFMEIFVKRKGLKLNPISVMNYCSLLVHSVDFSREAKDGCPRDMELSTCYPNTQFSLYFCTQSISFSSLLFADTMLTMINLFGYGIDMLACVRHICGLGSSLGKNRVK
ncbi:putative sugar phosphate/phosphate translocator [Camellia lanceoleosa]|nr:putative sugar phosphate/phosphate translocator [Camellia lanceoleosa]